jgi:hypothetical protein
MNTPRPGHPYCRNIIFSFFSVQNVLDIGAGDTRYISVYEACLHPEPPKDSAEKAIRPIRSILSGLLRLTAFCRPILGNPNLQPEYRQPKGYFIIEELKGFSLKDPLGRFPGPEEGLKLLSKELLQQTSLREATLGFCFILLQPSE